VAATSFDPDGWSPFQRRVERQSRETIRQAVANPSATFQRNTPPLNVLGGHSFPGAPDVDLKPDVPPPVNNDLLADDDHESGIPEFLRRSPSKLEKWDGPR
jgi:hypothetical protein